MLASLNLNRAVKYSNQLSSNWTKNYSSWVVTQLSCMTKNVYLSFYTHKCNILSCNGYNKNQNIIPTKTWKMYNKNNDIYTLMTSKKHKRCLTIYDANCNLINLLCLMPIIHFHFRYETKIIKLESLLFDCCVIESSESSFQIAV